MRKFIAILQATCISVLISSMAFGAGTEVRKWGEYDLSWGPYGTTWTSPSGKAVRYIPRFFSIDAFTDNLTLYGKGVTGDNTGRVQGFSIGSSSYTDNGYFADLITGGPWVDVREYLPNIFVIDGSVNYNTQINAALNNTNRLPILLPRGVWKVNSLIPTAGSGTRRWVGGIFGMGDAYHTGNDNTYGTWLIQDSSVPAGTPLIDDNNVWNFRMGGIALVGPGRSVSGSIGIKIYGTSSKHIYRDMSISGFETGFQGGTASDQANNDIFRLHNVTIGDGSGASTDVMYAFRMYGSQALNWIVDGAHIGGDYAIKCESSAPYTGASVQINNSFIYSRQYILDNPSTYGYARFYGNHIENGLTDNGVRLVNGGVGGSNASVGISFLYNHINYGGFNAQNAVPLVTLGANGPFVFIGNKVSHPNPVFDLNLASAPTFVGNHWDVEPRIYSSGSLAFIQPALRIGELVNAPNNMDGNPVSENGRGLPFMLPGGLRLERSSAGAPTSGTWEKGSVVFSNEAFGGNSSTNSSFAWMVTQPGTFSSASTTGNTTAASNTITSIASTVDFRVNDWITVSNQAGDYFKILSKTSTTITANNNFAYSGTGITVSTPDPAYKALISPPDRNRATLVNGTVTVNSVFVVANANILLTNVAASGTVGTLSVGTINPNTTFVINSTSASDNSVVYWEIR